MTDEEKTTDLLHLIADQGSYLLDHARAVTRADEKYEAAQADLQDAENDLSYSMGDVESALLELIALIRKHPDMQAVFENAPKHSSVLQAFAEFAEGHY